MSHAAESPKDLGHDVTLEELAAFASGTADRDTRARVKSAMLDIRHPLSYLIRTEEEVRAGKPPSIAVDASEQSPLAEDGVSRASQPMMREPDVSVPKWECPAQWIEEGRKAKREQFERALKMQLPPRTRIRVIGALSTPAHPVVEQLRAEGFPIDELRKRLHLDSE